VNHLTKMKSLKIPKGYCNQKAVNRRRTDNTMA